MNTLATPWLDAELNKENVLHFINYAWDRMLATFANVPEPALTTLYDSQGWSIIDHLAHITAWETSLLALLRGHDRMAAMGISDDLPHEEEVINAALQSQSRQQPAALILANLSVVHLEVLAELAMLSDEDLQRPYSYYQPNDPPRQDGPVINWVGGNTISHYHDHTYWISQILQQARY